MPASASSSSVTQAGTGDGAQTAVERARIEEANAIKSTYKKCSAFHLACRAEASATFARACAEMTETMSADEEKEVGLPDWPSNIAGVDDPKMVGWQAQQALDAHGITSHYIRKVYTDGTCLLAPCT